jgi:hypothetical protein
LIAGSADAPIQIGIGRWMGSGLMPAAVTRWKRPWKVTTGSVHSRRISSICSVKRRARLLKLNPSASYSTWFQPMPTPSRSRPPVSTSTSAACLATRAVWRWGRMMTLVTSSSRGTSPAR